MIKFEYKQLSSYDDINIEDLNALGNEGWELVHIKTSTKGYTAMGDKLTDINQYMFKRMRNG